MSRTAAVRVTHGKSWLQV